MNTNDKNLLVQSFCQGGFRKIFVDNIRQAILWIFVFDLVFLNKTFPGLGECR